MNQISILLPDLRGGGAERVCLNLANDFASRGVPVQMVLMRADGELLPRLDQRVEVVDLGVVRVRNALWPLLQHLRQSSPAALLANMWPLTFLAALARWWSRVPCRLLVVEHTTWSTSPLMQRWLTRLAFKASMRWMRPRVDAVMTVSQGAATDLERFVGLPAGSILACYNPVTGVPASHAASIHLAPSAAAWAQGPQRRVLAVGALKAAKNFPLLLDAVARLRQHIDARLLILGEGDLRPALEAQVRALDLHDAVYLPGFAMETVLFYSHADLFVLSSDYEGFGNVIVEALEHGVPVVSTDCPSGPREILEDGRHGRLVPVGDAQALADAMLEALQSPHDAAALKRRAQDFSVDRIADQYLDLLLPGWRGQSTA
ncbi:glycosyltransferase [Pseudoxanthomonas koreensis]|uniref:glycosyltransferase n=1 Tax=Pseudoxanthomonas koreensis TaxID=266061 RepID=UPI0013916E6C|nr:glycosyltransferase [Pseudoxanthomonas koreensis]KAF1695304.1 glycosyl transferase [Pseudoxanthomonas koreensis]